MSGIDLNPPTNSGHRAPRVGAYYFVLRSSYVIAAINTSEAVLVFQVSKARRRRKFPYRMVELFVYLGCTGIVVFLHGANFLFHLLSRPFHVRSLSFLGFAG
ncbi:hypothetical protein QN277_006063 [Acacia crassicarpa]|uniref:Uncharacterized protein n=1 Tax=Acacia crassicarpa TaxID=499986 RepID=A0AAE1MC70_9FABA|nr:hypothetical protein QN277_006063 [Acacia crassicarpa]